MTQNINLYERQPARKRTLWSREGALATLLVAVAASGIMATLDARSTAAIKAEIDSSKREADRIERLLAQVPSAASSRAEKLATEEREVITLEIIAARLSAGVLGRAGSFTDHLKAFGRASAEGVWLTGIKLNHGAGSLTLEGKAVDASRVPGLIEALGKQPLFSGTAFSTIDVKAEDAREPGKEAVKETVRFRIATGDALRAPAHRTEPIKSADAGAAASLQAARPGGVR